MFQRQRHVLHFAQMVMLRDVFSIRANLMMLNARFFDAQK